MSKKKRIFDSTNGGLFIYMIMIGLFFLSPILFIIIAIAFICILLLIGDDKGNIHI